VTKLYEVTVEFTYYALTDSAREAESFADDAFRDECWDDVASAREVTAAAQHLEWHGDTLVYGPDEDTTLDQALAGMCLPSVADLKSAWREKLRRLPSAKISLLVRPDTAPRQVRYPADVDGMRSILNAAGMDAAPIDIQWAWESFSEDEYFAVWFTPNPENPKLSQWIKEALLRYLVPCADHSAGAPHNTKISGPANQPVKSEKTVDAGSAASPC